MASVFTVLLFLLTSSTLANASSPNTNHVLKQSLKISCFSEATSGRSDLIFRISVITLNPIQGEAAVTFRCSAWRLEDDGGAVRKLHRISGSDRLKSFPKTIQPSEDALSISPPELMCKQDECFFSGHISAYDGEFVCSRNPEECQTVIELHGFQQGENASHNLDGARFGGGLDRTGHGNPSKRRRMNIGGYMVIGMGLVVLLTVLLIGCAKVRAVINQRKRTTGHSGRGAERGGYEVHEQQVDKINVAKRAIGLQQ